MSSVKFNIPATVRHVEKHAEAALDLAADIVVSHIKPLTPFDTGNLKTSTAWRKISKLKRRIFNNTIYAAIHEFGGVIKPVKAKALAVPIHKDAKGKSPGDFGDELDYIKRTGASPLLVRKKGKRWDLMFVLVKSVTIKAQPYMRPGYRAAIPKVKQFFKSL